MAKRHEPNLIKTYKLNPNKKLIGLLVNIVIRRKAVGSATKSKNPS